MPVHLASNIRILKLGFYKFAASLKRHPFALHFSRLPSQNFPQGESHAHGQIVGAKMDALPFLSSCLVTNLHSGRPHMENQFLLHSCKPGFIFVNTSFLSEPNQALVLSRGQIVVLLLPRDLIPCFYFLLCHRHYVIGDPEGPFSVQI